MCEIIVAFILATGPVEARIGNLPCDRLDAIRDSVVIYPKLPSGDTMGAVTLSVPAAAGQ